MTEKKINLGGRPPIFDTPEDMQILIKEYITNCPDTQMRMFKLKDSILEKLVPCPTITGLVLYLGFCDRQSFYDYEKKDKFTCTIKTARTFIENVYEKLLQQGLTAAMFALKNFGWTDSQEIKLKQTNDFTNIDKEGKTFEELVRAVSSKLSKNA